MFIVNVWEDGQWKADSVFSDVVDAEYYMICMKSVDSRVREIRKLSI